MVSDDGHGVIEPHDLTHALDVLGRSIVHTLHTTAKDRRLRKGGDLNARRPNIDAIDGRSIDLGGRVETLGRDADEFELPRRLRGTLSGTGIRAASAASSPYVKRLPVDT
jgi:hypothetical protein